MCNLEQKLSPHVIARARKSSAYSLIEKSLSLLYLCDAKIKTINEISKQKHINFKFYGKNNRTGPWN